MSSICTFAIEEPCAYEKEKGEYGENNGGPRNGPIVNVENPSKVIFTQTCGSVRQIER
jgi:hypothetical protein